MSSPLSIHRPGPAPNLLVRPNYGLEERPRLFCGWWPFDPSLPLYVYFGRSLSRPPKWAPNALGRAKDGKGDTCFEGAMNIMSQAKAWAPAIAGDMEAAKIGPASKISKKRKVVLQKHYDAQTVILSRNEVHEEKRKKEETLESLINHEDLPEDTPTDVTKFNLGARYKAKMAEAGLTIWGKPLENSEMSITDNDDEVEEYNETEEDGEDGEDDGGGEDDGEGEEVGEVEVDESRATLDRSEVPPGRKTLFSWGGLKTPLPANPALIAKRMQDVTDWVGTLFPKEQS